jgi:uncharacterized protein (DUF952 family)
MPKIVGNRANVVDHDGLIIDELVGNVACSNSSKNNSSDVLSVAHVQVSKPTAEPWLTIQYDEWLCCRTGVLEIHSMDATTGDLTVLKVGPGETCFIATGERFRPVFPEPVEYIAVCIPAFTPDRCHREDDDVGHSDVAAKLQQLHTGTTTGEAKSSTDNGNDNDVLYHMCQKALWEEAFQSGEAYFPPTFEADGGFTHATAIPARLLATANHFYTHTSGDWMCLQLSQSSLKKCGIVTRFEEPMAVGTTASNPAWDKEWKCPHVYGGIPTGTTAAVVVTAIRPMIRDKTGAFLSIEGLS